MSCIGRDLAPERSADLCLGGVIIYTRIRDKHTQRGPDWRAHGRRTTSTARRTTWVPTDTETHQTRASDAPKWTQGTSRHSHAAPKRTACCARPVRTLSARARASGPALRAARARHARIARPVGPRRRARVGGRQAAGGRRGAAAALRAVGGGVGRGEHVPADRRDGEQSVGEAAKGAARGLI